MHNLLHRMKGDSEYLHARIDRISDRLDAHSSPSTPRFVSLIGVIINIVAVTTIIGWWLH